MQGMAAFMGLAVAIACAGTTSAEVSEVRISKGYGVHFLPMYVVEHERLFEREAAKAGLGEIKVEWSVVDGGNVINDAMLSGALDIAAIGVPGFLTLWAKAKGNPRAEVVGLAPMSSGSMYLNTRNPAIKTLDDFSSADKIAMPGIKTSFAAVILEMVVAKTYGDQHYDKLDAFTVGMPYPEAVAALLSGKTEIDAHVASPPFSYLELRDPRVHRVFNSADVLGRTSVIMAHSTRRFYEANPKLAAAFIAAIDDATKRIAADHAWAAKVYNEMAAVKSSQAEILEILNDPDNRFSTAPEHLLDFATFLHRVGRIKVAPESWKDLFVPELGDRAGS